MFEGVDSLLLDKGQDGLPWGENEWNFARWIRQYLEQKKIYTTYMITSILKSTLIFPRMYLIGWDHERVFMINYAFLVGLLYTVSSKCANECVPMKYCMFGKL